ncbi:hypothetical protein PDIG_77990 [Penicillium digitatum PHI26]|uniref:Uncharacterized protein n=2 Tax=Penicillium digitatum TaxID=36651 RepID=K9FU14_PEND2|nr:hypothetical protein PDIP_26420 [Penicillium digitatum Pd1]EKV06238.1 hypothetical protein PDIG_77990 [Penicillium digitatum PHI26]EKV18672.1 hypothetical protein PDIP_26420 [Penicillium digitatum Pd1]
MRNWGICWGRGRRSGLGLRFRFGLCFVKRSGNR